VPRRKTRKGLCFDLGEVNGAFELNAMLKGLAAFRGLGNFAVSFTIAKKLEAM
jgi:hypothetical protein